MKNEKEKQKETETEESENEKKKKNTNLHTLLMGKNGCWTLPQLCVPECPCTYSINILHENPDCIHVCKPKSLTTTLNMYIAFCSASR